MVLDANPGYWGGPPRSTRLVFLDTGEDARGEAMLEAQAVDVLLTGVAPSRTAGTQSMPSWRIGYLALEAEREPFSRLKARQAVAAALDPALLAPRRRAGRGAAALVPAARGLGASRRLARPRGEPGERQAPAHGGGLPDGGRRRASSIGDGDKRPDLSRVAEAIRASLANAGVSVPIQIEAPEAALQLARTGQHQMALLEARVEAGDPHFLLYPLTSSEGASKGPTALNMSFYRNRTLDDLLIRASQVSFRPERQRLYAARPGHAGRGDAVGAALRAAALGGDPPGGAQPAPAPERESSLRPRLDRRAAGGRGTPPASQR